jgi:hypothetical protein
MKTGKLAVLAILAAGVLFSMGCQAGGFNPGAEWTQVYSSDFGSGKAPEWAAVSGEVKPVDGALVLLPADEGETQAILKAPKCPGSVVVECVATPMPKGGKVSDLSPILNASDTGYDAGYMLQFGAKANTVNHLLKEGQQVAATDKPLLEAGKTYHVVAMNDGGKVSLMVDGKEVISYNDKGPLMGKGHDQVGFYTYQMTLKLSKVTVWVKKNEMTAAPMK